MSNENQDLSSSYQELAAEMTRLRAELNSLKERAQTLPQPDRPIQPAPAFTATRRHTLKRLGLALLAGAASATALGAGQLAQAKLIANPATNSLAGRVGTLIIPAGSNQPVNSLSGTEKIGLLALNDSSVDLNGVQNLIPSQRIAIFASGGIFGVGLYAVSQNNSAIFATSSNGGNGVYSVTNGNNNNTYAIWGDSTSGSGYAGVFTGSVMISGPLSKPGGSFKIDHPLDPANQYLYHSFVESPDMKNIYDGVVVLDGQGSALVELPRWFETLNSDFRYTLTPLGEYSPLYVAQKIKGNKFKIGGGKPGQEVSWQVTGIRQDAWAKAHRIPVEETKPDAEKGTYIHPELFGQPPEKSVTHKKMMKQ